MRTRANCGEKKIFIPAVLGFDHLVLGSSPRLGVQSEAREEPLQMHKRHFVELAFLSIVKGGKFKSQGPVVRQIQWREREREREDKKNLTSKARIYTNDIIKL